MDLLDTINSIRQDFLSVSYITNEELLAICTCFRLEEINDKYEFEFDKLINSLQQNYINETDFDKLTISLNSLSSTLSILCTTLLNHINFYSINENSD